MSELAKNILGYLDADSLRNAEQVLHIFHPIFIDSIPLFRYVVDGIMLSIMECCGNLLLKTKLELIRCGEVSQSDAAGQNIYSVVARPVSKLPYSYVYQFYR